MAHCLLGHVYPPPLNLNWTHVADRRPWVLRATWMETVAESPSCATARLLLAGPKRWRSAKPREHKIQNPNPQPSSAWRAREKAEERSAGELSGSDLAAREGEPRSETTGQKFTFLASPAARQPGSPGRVCKLPPGSLFQGSWERAGAASESRVSPVRGAPAAQAPAIPPSSRRKRKKLGAELAGDLGGYSRSKALEMAAEGAGSADFSSRRFSA